MNNKRKLVAKLANELYSGKITFDEFSMNTPEESSDEEISELIYLIEHEPQKEGFMGVSSEEHEKYLKEINKLIESLSK